MFNSGDALRRFTPFFLVLVGLGLFRISGCSAVAEKENAAKTSVLRLATTTSTRDSGLLDELLPLFERQHRCRVDVVAVGTGAALRIGEAGDADVVMVHAREAEEAFMKAKHGVRHEEFMYNDFVLLGPKDDPAQIRGAEPIEAVKKIAAGQYRFVSRGDDSGTHKREMSLWKGAGRQPAWNDYIESGQGMGPTLLMADEKRAYVLADMGTYLNFRDRIELTPLASAAENLRNPYAAIVVNPQKNSKINAMLANAFVDFLISAEVQRLIAGYRIAGRQLFHPTRLDETN